MEIAELEENLKLPYHQAILNDEIPLSIGEELDRHVHICICLELLISVKLQ